jgi:hypothetical protein
MTFAPETLLPAQLKQASIVQFKLLKSEIPDKENRIFVRLHETPFKVEIRAGIRVIMSGRSQNKPDRTNRANTEI